MKQQSAICSLQTATTNMLIDCNCRLLTATADYFLAYCLISISLSRYPAPE